ncbi:MAG: pyruvate, phosphate dikinase [Spirochaetales bacterium]|nr:pyruvate, phosphate dikinase [Spirochaetales bacterium]
MTGVYPFSKTVFTDKDRELELCGVRGQRMMELAALDIPILPGFVLSNEQVMNLEGNREEALKLLNQYVGTMEPVVDKKFNGKESPLLIKVVVSSTLNMVDTTSSIHNIGLCDATVGGFADKVGEEFAYHEYRGMVKRVLLLDLELEKDKKNIARIEGLIKEASEAKDVASSKKFLESVKKFYPSDFFENADAQLLYVLTRYREIFKMSEVLNDSALLIQAMIFGNYGKESYSGFFYTRDIETGKDELSGLYFVDSFDDADSKGVDILKLKKNYLDELIPVAKSLEAHYKQIRRIKFTVEDGTLWIIDQTEATNKSAMAEIKTLLSLHKQGLIDDEYAINDIRPPRLAEILHPVLNKEGSGKIKSVKGGISGAIGAAVGRVFFSTDRLVKEARIAHQRGLEDHFILAMPATYAEDVKAIEVSRGVIARDGGYASHAPVVARSLGKVAMINPDIVFNEKGMKIEGIQVNEGDYLSLDVPSYDKPTIYFGELDLIEPSMEESGLLEFLDIVQKGIGDFDVHVNADQPREAELAKKFGARGIGLCRTEHMFFDEKRIPVFRSMIITDDSKDREKILAKLQKNQVDDFLALFRIMDGYPVTIRLLDAPLHEFLPHTKDKMDEFISFFQKSHPGVTAEEIRNRCDILGEVNPMLGHRGVRLAISIPEVYRMQVTAIFEAAYKLRKDEGITSYPEIMIPIVMSPSELKAVRYGKKIEGKEIIGIETIEEQVREKLGVEPLPYKVGTMIELPSAALMAGNLARYADFFSFGTNDLTQTTMGLSRDDFNTFFPDYNEFDLLEKNPFSSLNAAVKELVSIASQRGRLVRPDLKMGLCGEHGAEPDNIEFLKEAGLNYVSCSPYGVPIAKLAIARSNLKTR